MSENIPEDLKYTDTHEWVKMKNEKTVVVGITDHAQKELTDIVFVELPAVGKEVKKGEEMCIVESIKSVSEIYAPISGKITAVNKELEDSPEKINNSPYEEGWLVEIEIANKDELNSLLDADAYKKLISK
ncbi:MAG: glycine cleavage system protein GcvH [Spirochaetes bacterium]|nr:MAG: glycine cleavage system protein GcvH [Spirochaetota bacterium]HDO70355.1 glycine cleavage system protein GcvH [Thermoplasmatales archaeon]HEX08719.1 glycine cleavage system protein GcvH [Thermoplasmatales archaeon]